MGGIITRRDIIKSSIGLIGVSSSLFASNFRSHSFRRLNLYNTHINKAFYPKIFNEDGSYNLVGLFEIDKALMDYRAYKIKRTDLNLISLLYQINGYIGFDRKIYILSGYRTPQTNNYLRKHTKGVAKHSFHIQAKAVDIHIDGMRLSRVKDIVRNINENGGVGYYPNSGFVHMDVGPKREWQG